MALCPVCETPRVPPGLPNSLECPTCGLIFEHKAVDASIVPLPELEPTRASDLQVPIETIPGLELTSLGDGALGIPTAAPLDGFEPTVSAAVQVSADATPGLEPTRVSDDDLPSTLPAQVQCRYCGAAGQKEGLFCDRCGMRLPRVADSDGAPAEAALPLAGAQCRSCGSRNVAPGRCLECGARMASVT